MALIRLYLDEDVFVLLASVLRARGFDVVSAHEAGQRGRLDVEQFAFAAQQSRAVLTFNIRDFHPLASAAMKERRSFSGLVLSAQIPFGELLKRTLHLLDKDSAERIANNVVWLSDYR